ncbi:hypothetical protein GALL_528940 [mine drainage metagenome]|uniref:Uncharacterized protein n=1 Tax=mine drainage metagenome TaxID=410659 RepID=A0A1J5P1W9_9ZZZZ
MGASTLPREIHSAPVRPQSNIDRLTQTDPMKTAGMARQPQTMAAKTAKAAGGQNGEEWEKTSAGSFASAA